MYESTKVISECAVKASERAIKEAKAHGVSITYLSGSDIIEEAPDGSKVVIDTIPLQRSKPLPKSIELV